MGLPQSLDWIGFGVESFGGAGTSIDGRFDDIVVSASRVGCGSPPGTIDTTSTTQSTTTTTTTASSSTTTTTPSSSTTTTWGSATGNCGFIPSTCVNPIGNAYKNRSGRKLGKFEEVTLVSKEDATIEDMQLFYFCRNKNPTKCTGLEAPCTCSRPPCFA